MAVLIDSKEVCEKLNITLNNLYQLKFRKQLMPVERKGKKAYYNLEDVEMFRIKRNGKNA